MEYDKVIGCSKETTVLAEPMTESIIEQICLIPINILYSILFILNINLQNMKVFWIYVSIFLTMFIDREIILSDSLEN